MSGETAKEALKMTQKKVFEEGEGTIDLKPRHAYYRRIFNIFRPKPSLIDEGLILYFKGPHSFTGEDMLEF